MVSHPNRSRYARWINSLEGLDDEPVRRAAQIALAALDTILTSGDLTDDTAAVAAYDELQKALAQTASVHQEPEASLARSRK